MDIIENYYKAFNNKNWPEFFSLLDDQVIHDVNQGDREVGITKFKAFMDRMDGAYDEQISDIVIMADPKHQRFAVEYLVKGKYLKGEAGFPAARGQTYELPGVAIFEIKNKKITRISNYYNLNLWIEKVR